MTTYVFPGQGSQIKGMGGSLFTEFQDYVQKADRILGYSIAALCLDDPNGQLNNTEYTQPALFTVSALTYLKKLNETGTKPNYVAGHSLGEYNALLVADVFDFETGLKLVKERGRLMSQATGGGMAAVVGLKADDVQAILNKNNLKEIVIANYNTNTQVVISGPKDAVSTTEPLFIQAGAMLFMPLKVSGAFHSPYMEDAKKQFETFLHDFTFASPTIPVIANVSAKPYPPIDIASFLSQQITHPVLWTQSIQYLIGQGETIFEEIGPGKVLAGLVARIQKGQ